MKSPVITLTPSAWQVIWSAQEGFQPARLRVGVKGGGCSGYEYVLESETVHPAELLDTRQDQKFITWRQDEPDGDSHPGHFSAYELGYDLVRGIYISVDVISAQYLKGTTIDYVKQGLIDEGFRFDNPNAKTRCGCGKSFGT